MKKYKSFCFLLPTIFHIRIRSKHNSAPPQHTPTMATIEQVNLLLKRIESLEAQLQERNTVVQNDQVVNVLGNLATRVEQIGHAAVKTTVRKFSGTNRDYPYNQFSTQLRLHFLNHHTSYSNDTSKMIFTLSVLEGAALAYVEPHINNIGKTNCIDFLKSNSKLLNELQAMFGPTETKRNHEYEIFNLRQTGDITEYITKFRLLQSYVKWDDSALHFHYYQGLSFDVQREINKRGETSTLTELIEMSIKAAAFLNQQKNQLKLRNQYSRPTYTPPRSQSYPQDMEIDSIKRTPLTPAQREEYMRKGLCFKCSQPGHRSNECKGKRAIQLTPVTCEDDEPEFVDDVDVAASSVSATQQRQFSIPIQIVQGSNSKHNCAALIDSGAQKTFIDENLAKELGLKMMTLRNPFNINLANGATGRKPITQAIKTKIQVGDRHVEDLFAYVTSVPQHKFILGLDWMKKHQPTLDFSRLNIDFKSEYCNKTCLVKHYLKIPQLQPTTHLTPIIKEQLKQEKSIEDLKQIITEIKNIPIKKNNHPLKTNNQLKIQLLSKDAKIPTRGSKRAAGLDLSSSKNEVIPPQSQKLIPTDLAIKAPSGTYARIAPRSGLALKKFIDVGAGVIDEDYTGPVGVVLYNHAQQPFEIKKGDKIAQVILEKNVIMEPTIVESLEKTERGNNGFGSTGTRMKGQGTVAIDKQQESFDSPVISICSIEEIDDREIELLEEFDNMEQLLATIDKPENEEPKIPKEYKEFEELFKDKEVGQLPPRRSFDHAIPIQKDKTVPFGPLYKLAPKELDELKKYINENLEKGFIEKSTSPAGAPVLFVKKKDGSLRLCVDYRKLNDISIKNRCPLPLIDETFDQLKDATIFTKLDLKGAYNLVRIAKGDEWKTAFRTRYGHFQYNVMPFGLTNAPATFQSLINEVLREHLDDFVVTYIDDILIYSKNKKEHQQHVKTIMKKLMDAQLQVKLSKCEFNKNEVEFLGFIISGNEIKMDPKKIKSIVEWKSPKSAHDIQIFLGFANFYRRFIQNYSKVVAPITKLLKKDEQNKWEWTNDAESAFQLLKEMFISEPVLKHFDHQLGCILETDASSTAIGAIISQEHNDRIHPIAYYSRSLTPAERNYHIHDKELLAIIEALQHWRHYLIYSQHKTKIFTDHKNLSYFMEKRRYNARQLRWSEILSNYNFDIIYKSGSNNKNADALSRKDNIELDKTDEEPPILNNIIGLNATTRNRRRLIEDEEDEEDEETQNTTPHSEESQILFEYNSDNESELSTPLHDGLPTTPEQYEFHQQSDLINNIRQRIKEDNDYKEIIQNIQNDPETEPEYRWTDNLLFYNGRIVVPKDDTIKRDILQECHNEPTAGHFGIYRTNDLVSRTFYWEGLKNYVKQFVKSCDICQRSKANRHKPFGLLQSLPIPDTPWTSIAMDFIVQLPISNGFDAILVVIDRFTKLAHFIPTTTELTSEELTDLLVQHIISKHGIPNDIVTDRGSVFTAHFMKAFCEGLKIEQKLTTAYHPQTNGQTERTNQTLEQYLRCYINYQQDDWSKILPLAEFSYNNTIQASIETTPFYALYGYDPRFSAEIPLINNNVPKANERITHLQQVREDLKFYLESAQDNQAKYYNKKVKEMEFEVNQEVMLNKKFIKTTRPSNKLDYKKLGPFKITAKVGSRAYRLQLPTSMARVHPVFHISLLEPYIKDTNPNTILPPPPPIIIDDNEEFLVETILDARIKQNRTEYLVHWEGYNIADRTWETLDNLNCRRLLSEFHNKYPNMPGKAEFKSKYPSNHNLVELSHKEGGTVMN